MLPEITEVERFTYRPGDRFIIHIEANISHEIAWGIAEMFRGQMNLPDDVPVVVLGKGARVEIVSESDADV